MKAHFVRYILYKGMSYGTLYSTALSIGIVFAVFAFAGNLIYNYNIFLKILQFFL